MLIVIDTNIVISALLKQTGKTKELIFSDKFSLIAPEYLFGEILKHKKELMKKSGLSEPQITLALSIIFSRVSFVPRKEFDSLIKKSISISPDDNDSEFFALALKNNCPIWSNDKQLKNQEVVKIINTTELLKQFRFE